MSHKTEGICNPPSLLLELAEATMAASGSCEVAAAAIDEAVTAVEALDVDNDSKVGLLVIVGRINEALIESCGA